MPSNFKRVQMLLTPDQVEWLDQAAEQYGQDRSGFLRLILQDIRKNGGKMPSEGRTELALNFQKRLDELDDLKKRVQELEEKKG